MSSPQLKVPISLQGLLRSFIVALVGLTLSQDSSLAQSDTILLTNTSRPVIVSEARTGVPIQVPENYSQYRLYRGPEKAINEALDVPSVAGRSIPDCAAPSVRRERLGPTTSSFEPIFDVVLYNPENEEHRKGAASWTGDLVSIAPSEDYLDTVRRSPVASFLMTQTVRCLPTRARIVALPDGQYREFREGAEAWRKNIN